MATKARTPGGSSRKTGRSGRTAADDTAKTAAKAGATRAAKSAAKSAAKPTAAKSTAAKSTAKSTAAKAARKPAAKAAAKIVAKTVTKTVTKSARKPAAKSATAAAAKTARAAAKPTAAKAGTRSPAKPARAGTASVKPASTRTASAKTASAKTASAKTARTPGKAAAAKTTRARAKTGAKVSAAKTSAAKPARAAATRSKTAKAAGKPARAGARTKQASTAPAPAAAARPSARSSKPAAKPAAKSPAAKSPAAKARAKPAAKPAKSTTPALPASRAAPRRAASSARRAAVRPLPPKPAEEPSARSRGPAKVSAKVPAKVPAKRPAPPPPAVRRPAALPMVVEVEEEIAPAAPALVLPRGVAVLGRLGPRYDEVLTAEALAFLAGLHRHFDARRVRLLQARAERQARFNAGELPDFLPETRHVREQPWRVAPIPPDLLDRRVEITGPVDRKMIINALNSGAKVFMADFEDSNAPTFANTIEGQINLKDRWHAKVFDHVDPVSGKHYRLGDRPAVLMVRPRGWHLVERHVEVDGKPVSASLFDFGLYAFHTAKAALAKGSGPYFYLPKLESHLEARLWNDVFAHTEAELDLHRGSIKATVLIETLPAAFEMHEILHELKDHIVGLNCGRWDYIFSFIKKLAKNPDFILPDRGQVVMGKAFLKAYSQLLIQTCHQRGAFAMGGMAAQIPIKGDTEKNAAAFAKVRADKEREAGDGHDGTWVAHPDLVPVAMEVFDRMMPGKNQLDELREDVDVGQAELLEVHQGTRTEAGFRENIRVGVQYIEAWLRGRGAVPIYNLMEDAATAEISRAQIWQWLKYGAKLDDGTQVTPAFFEKALHEEMERVRGEVGEEAFAYGRFPEAIQLFHRLAMAAEFEEFLTIPAYALID